MNDHSCNCHCRETRIVFDDQLLEDRQVWRDKYENLQRKANQDITTLKENIYAQCATLMQKEFRQREQKQIGALNEKNAEIKSMTVKIINLESRNKILERENEIYVGKIKEIESELNQVYSKGLGKDLSSPESDQQWESKLSEEVGSAQRKINQQWQEKYAAKEDENDMLRQKVKDFEKKYEMLIPEVEKLRQNLSSKSITVEQLEAKLDRLKRDQMRSLEEITSEKQLLSKGHANCQVNADRLNQRIEQLLTELQRIKKMKKEIKVEPVYVDRPVEVEKVVEKIVEKVVHIDKGVYMDKTDKKNGAEKMAADNNGKVSGNDGVQMNRELSLEQENNRLRQEINVLLNELNNFENKFKQAISQYENCIKMHEDNTEKYKRERERLVKTIEQLTKELDSIHEPQVTAGCNCCDSEKIIVRVSKDGTYQKTVQRKPQTQVVVPPPKPPVKQNTKR